MCNFLLKLSALFRGVFDMSEYYDEGWQAFYNNASRLDNPYIDGTYAYAQWELGFDEAETDMLTSV